MSRAFSTLSRSVVVLSIAAASLALAACAGSADAADVASDCKPQHEFSTVKKGVLSVAAVDYFPVSVTSDGEFRGSEADLMKNFAEQNCLSVDVVEVSFAGAIPAVDSGRADVAIGGFYRTAERGKVIGLSNPIYLDRLGLISKDGLTTVSSIEGKKVGTVDGYLWTPDTQKTFGSDVTVYPSNVEMKADLENGRIDVALDSYGGAQFLFKDDSEFVVSVLESDSRIATTEQPAQIGFPFTLGNDSLGTALNAAIAGWQKDDTLVNTLKEYGQPTDILDVGEPRLLK